MSNAYHKEYPHNDSTSTTTHDNTNIQEEIAVSQNSHYTKDPHTTSQSDTHKQTTPSHTKHLANPVHLILENPNHDDEKSDDIPSDIAHEIIMPLTTHTDDKEVSIPHSQEFESPSSPITTQDTHNPDKAYQEDKQIDSDNTQLQTPNPQANQVATPDNPIDTTITQYDDTQTTQKHKPQYTSVLHADQLDLHDTPNSESQQDTSLPNNAINDIFIQDIVYNKQTSKNKKKIKKVKKYKQNWNYILYSKRLFAGIVIIASFIGLYGGYLLFGTTSFEVLWQLHQAKNVMIKEIEESRIENAQLQKKVLELQSLEPK